MSPFPSEKTSPFLRQVFLFHPRQFDPLWARCLQNQQKRNENFVPNKHFDATILVSPQGDWTQKMDNFHTVIDSTTDQPAADESLDPRPWHETIKHEMSLETAKC